MTDISIVLISLLPLAIYLGSKSWRIAQDKVAQNNPATMPANLSAAHKALDKCVDAAYGKKGLKTDAERLAYLFTLYEKYTSLLA
jgi:type IV secretory pathway VirB6-like protein